MDVIDVVVYFLMSGGKLEGWGSVRIYTGCPVILTRSSVKLHLSQSGKEYGTFCRMKIIGIIVHLLAGLK